MMHRLRRLRAVRLTRAGVGAVSVVSILATGLVIATALGRTSAQSQAIALLRRPRVERVVLPPRPAPPVPAAATPPAPKLPPVVTASTQPTQPATTTTSSTTTTTTTTTTPATTPVPSKAKHVFVIALTTSSYRAAFGPGSGMHYLDHVLRPKGDLLSRYESLGATDLPDYLAMVSGQGPNFDTERGCTTYSDFPGGASPSKDGEVPGRGCVYPNTILTVGDQLDAADMGWKGYFEDLGSALPPAQQNCQHPNSGAVDSTLTPVAGNDYATSENPFVYFHSLLDLGDCTSDDLPLTGLTADLGSAHRTANLVYIAPGLCDDGSDTPCPTGPAATPTPTGPAATTTGPAVTPTGPAVTPTPTGPAAADAFLKQWVPLILRSPAYRKNGVLLIVFAPARAQLTPGASFGHPLRTGALVISRYAKAGSRNRGVYTPYSVLRSIEDLFALKTLGHAKAAKSFATVALPGAWAKTG
jgi:phosphatidylinositol-3-phosphatase